MSTYEYMVIPLDVYKNAITGSASHLELKLNELGAKGYKFVGMNKEFIVLQRPLNSLSLKKDDEYMGH